jgi:hypothetical protein
LPSLSPDVGSDLRSTVGWQRRSEVSVFPQPEKIMVRMEKFPMVQSFRKKGVLVKKEVAEF